MQQGSPLTPSGVSPEAWQHAASSWQRRSGRVAGTLAVVGLVVVIAIVVAIVAPKSSKPTTLPHAGPNPVQAVLTAAHRSATINSLTATMTEHVSGNVTATTTGTIAVQRKPLLMWMKLTETIAGHTVPLSAILTGQGMYMKLGSSLGLPSTLSGKWLKISFGRLFGSSRVASILRTLENENPESQTQLLGGITDARVVGGQTVSGVSTTKYTGYLVPSAALKYLPASLRPQLAPIMKLISGKIDISVWIDAQQRIRQLSEIEHVSGNTVAAEFTYSGFNKPVHIALPPASQVQSLTSMLAGKG
jgi:hypothetical protein